MLQSECTGELVLGACKPFGSQETKIQVNLQGGNLSSEKSRLETQSLSSFTFTFPDS
jgi:hypothetical protein